MQLVRLTIEDFKIFSGKHTISFPSDLSPVVFVGVNGAGKTTLLEAIIGSLWPFYNSMQGHRQKKSSFLDGRSVNIAADEIAEVSLNWRSGFQKELNSGFSLRKTIDPTVKFHEAGEVVDYVKTLKGDVGFHKTEASIPLLAYYPVERTVLNPSLKNSSPRKVNQFSAYHNALESAIDYDDFFEWFRNAEDIENEIRLNEVNTYTDLSLEAVRKAILAFLDGFTKIRVKRISRVSLVVEKRGSEFEISQLSHGEKAIIALVGDLARRMVVANPGLKNPLAGEGVVMIDEIDLHLHPKWQKVVLQKLVSVFPKLQIICTTHSPLVINHVHGKSVYLLEDGQCVRLNEKFRNFETFGADVVDILKIVQAAESLTINSISVKIDALFQAIERGDYEEAREEISALKGLTDPNHPDIQRAEAQLRYKELIG